MAITEAMQIMIAQADQLALQARAAALSGDAAKAEQLRLEFERIYDALEAEALGQAACQAAAPVRLVIQDAVLTGSIV